MDKKILIILVTALIVIGLSIFTFIQLNQEKSNPKVLALADISFGKAPMDIDFSAVVIDSDESSFSYFWDFGDGTYSTKKNPSHKFTEPAMYAVTLTITDDSGEIGQDTIIIQINSNQAPVAKINADQTVKKAPLKVNFIADGIDFDGKIVGYKWDFGDGTTSKERNTTHTYNEIGIYKVKLTVTDDEGSSNSDTLEINVIENYRPEATIAYKRGNNGRAPSKVDFSCEASDIDGTIVSYQWVVERALPYPLDIITPFFPTRTYTEQNISHYFLKKGRYYAKLTVTDDSGATYTTMKLINIKKNRWVELNETLEKIIPLLPII